MSALAPFRKNLVSDKSRALQKFGVGIGKHSTRKPNNIKNIKSFMNLKDIINKNRFIQ